MTDIERHHWVNKEPQLYYRFARSTFKLQDRWIRANRRWLDVVIAHFIDRDKTKRRAAMNALSDALRKKRRNSYVIGS